MNKIILGLLIVGVLLVVIIFSFKNVDGTNTQLANPAAVYCEAQGGDYLTEEESNSTASFCLLSNGSMVNAWDYFRLNNPLNE